MYYRLISNKVIQTSKIAQPGNRLQFYNILDTSTECLIKQLKLVCLCTKRKKKGNIKNYPQNVIPFVDKVLNQQHSEVRWIQ